MHYDISAHIDYDFQQPTVVGRTLLRLMPATLPGRQRLILGAVEADPPPAERLDRRDFFGNAVTELAFRAPVHGARMRVQARVERTARVEMLDLSPDLSRLGEEIDACAGLEAAAPHHFLGVSDRVRPRPEMTDWARGVTDPSATALATVQALGAALYAEMAFDAGATTVDTDPAEAFRQRHGVCQDFSHVMIACLRGLGIPAGYVSGYLRTLPPPGQDRLAGADAMHAWVRAWCGSEGGWVEFDPTNDLMVGDDHIVVAYGRDYDDVAPVRGVLRTAGGQSSRHGVDVVPLD